MATIGAIPLLKLPKMATSASPHPANRFETKNWRLENHRTVAANLVVELGDLDIFDAIQAYGTLLRG